MYVLVLFQIVKHSIRNYSRITLAHDVIVSVNNLWTKRTTKNYKF